MNDRVQTADSIPSARDVVAMASRFVPADIRADVSTLPESERRALEKLVEAARLMDSLFLRQVWAGNDAMLAGAQPSPAIRADRVRHPPRFRERRSRGCTIS